MDGKFSRLNPAQIKPGLLNFTIKKYLDKELNPNTLQELQKQVLQLPIRDRWQLLQAVLTSLQEETCLEKKSKNLPRLRGVAKVTTMPTDADNTQDYETYLTRKYQ